MLRSHSLKSRLLGIALAVGAAVGVSVHAGPEEASPGSPIASGASLITPTPWAATRSRRYASRRFWTVYWQ